MENRRGSEWRKWDLHVHTKGTAKNDQFKSENFDKFCITLFQKALENQISAIGITDYFSIDNYKKVLNFVSNISNQKEFTEGEKSEINKILILPNVELRILPVTSSGRLVNIHCLFNPEYVKKLDNDFFNVLEFSSGKRKYKMNKEGIENFGHSLNNNLTGKEEQYKKGLNNFVVSHERLQDLIKENDDFRENTLLVVSNSNKDGASALQKHYNFFEKADSSSLDGVRRSIYCISQLIFSSNEEDKKYFLGQKKDDQNIVKSKCGSLKACIHGSDAHKEADLFCPKANKYCWIKADLTFEGLKQIKYEPKTRVSIGENQPIKPINTINEIVFSLPTGAKIRDDAFCFSGNRNAYELSSFFNCFIGGRGSGKSTILNFLGLYSKYPASSQTFCKKLNPSFDVNSVFEFKGTETFEFLGQSEIESFASDKTKFTEAIYDRANSSAGNTLVDFELKISFLKKDLDKIIQANSDLKDLELEKQKKEKEKSTLEESVKIFTSEKFKKVNNEITLKSKEIRSFKDWKKKIDKLWEYLEDAVDDESLSKKEEIIENGYQKAYTKAVEKIREVLDSLHEFNFFDEEKKLLSIESELENLEEGFSKTITQAGYTPENVEQIKSAPQKITNLEGEIKSLSDEIVIKNKIVSTFSSTIESLKKEKNNYENKISNILTPLQDSLKKQYKDNKGKNIKEIALEYSFNKNKSWEKLAESFYSYFHNEYRGNERGKEVCEFILDNKETFEGDDYKEIQSLIKDSSKIDKEYIKFMKRVFESKKNYDIFRAIRDKNFFDVKEYKIISVTYGGKDVANASFGQKCTAVVVIMILFGNYPLIIDEPEAHLDSSLIANYLVPLLKEKKSDRQIIFATHNANFVINGDAEKIFILENGDTTTNIVETTIENTANRKELLKLEGGKEAFEKRGAKLNIK